MTKVKPHAALLASPGMGHLIPILELGKTMAIHHGFHITIFVVNANESSTSLLDSSIPEDLDIVSVPYVDIFDNIGSDTSLVDQLFVMMRESIPFLHSAISAMEFPPVMLVVDLFGMDAFHMAKEMGMLCYAFDTSNARFLSVVMYVSIASEELIREHVKKKKPLEIPGCKSLNFEDSINDFHEHPDNLDGFFQVGRRMFAKVDGILINTWEDLESETIEALRDEDILGWTMKGSIYPVGPIVRQVGPELSAHPVMGWLNGQPEESVIYVSFGSGGTMSAKQMFELAWGLELSRQRFVWVVRPPSDTDSAGSYFTIGQGSDFDPNYLPSGFLTRVRGFGLVVPHWAPQADVLSHPSIGAFLSHCGWNSTLESVINGVPMIAWPLYAEQKMNAAFLTEDVEVVIRPRPSMDGVVGKEEVAKMVRKILVDEKGVATRKRMNELKLSAEKAVRKGGSSYNSLSQVAKDCTQKYEGICL